MRREDIELLRRKWFEQDVAVKPGISDADVEEFVRKEGRLLPRDVIEFLRTINGMEQDEADPDTQIRFWSLSEFRPVSEELGGQNGPELEKAREYFLFADYSLWAHAYAIRLSTDPLVTNPVVLVGGKELLHVASSFSEFLTKYIEQPKQLF